MSPPTSYQRMADADETEMRDLPGTHVDPTYAHLQASSLHEPEGYQPQTGHGQQATANAVSPEPRPVSTTEYPFQPYETATAGGWLHHGEQTKGQFGPSVVTYDADEPGRWALPSSTTTRRDFWWGLGWVFDIVLSVIPLFFVVAAIIALRLDHQERSDLGEKIFDATRLGPTVFPIVFAAIAGRFFQNLSRWNLERPRGIKLGVLEQISGSQSFAGALHRAFVVRSGAVLTTVIVLIWALSPIGGQSSLRLFYHGHDTVEGRPVIYYARPEYQSAIIFASHFTLGDYTNMVFTLYTILLASVPARRAALTDTWDRPKIPQLPRAVIDDLNFEWQDVTQGGPRTGDEYASLLGMDVRGYSTDDPAKQYRFSVETSYMDMDCERVDTHRYGNMTRGTVESKTSFTAALQNFTASGQPKYWALNDRREGHRLLYDSHLSRGTYNFTERVRFECVMRRIPVEVEFHCGPFPATHCGARRLRQREAKSDVTPSWMTGNWPADGTYQILPWNINPRVMDNLLNKWPMAAGAPDLIVGASATDNFIAGDEHVFMGQRLRDWDVDAADMVLFSRRMTTAFNTLFEVSLNPWNITSTKASDLPPPPEAPEATTMTPATYYTPPRYNVTRATSFEARDVYVSDRGWCAALLVIAAVLEALAVAGLWLRTVIRGPDVLGFASTLTRDNPYFPASSQASGSALGGAERARRWRAMRVQMADVLPSEERGYLVFRAVEPSWPYEAAGGRSPIRRGRVFM